MREIFTFVGYAFFGPAGALIGGILADILFPREGPKGPRLNELNVQHSTVGAPVPIVYGTAALAGNVIWSGGLLETKHTDEQGGFLGFGGVKSTNYTYSVDVAIGICEGPISGIRRIWADADAIYDARSDADIIAAYGDTAETAEFIAGLRAASAQLDFVLYLGTDDQLPDPTIQAYENIGYVVNVVPAYRGLAYIVFNDFQLEKFGNRIPNFRMEVFSNGEEVDCGIYSAGHLEPWQYMIDSQVRDPRNPDNQHLYGYTENGGSALFSFETAMADINAATDHPSQPFIWGKVPQQGDSIYSFGWSVSTTPNYINPCDIDEPLNPYDLGTDYVGLQVTINAMRGPTGLGCRDDIPTGGTICQNWGAYLGGKYSVKYVSGGGGGSSGFNVITLHNESPTPYFGGIPYTSDDVSRPSGSFGCTLSGDLVDLWRVGSHEMGVTRWWAPLSTYGVTWTRVSGLFKSLRSYVMYQPGVYNLVYSYPMDPTLKSDHPFYDDEAFWTAAYDAAVASNASRSVQNQLPEDWVYGVDYPDERASHTVNFQNGLVWKSECTAAEVACVPMATIVTDICRRAGLRTVTATQIDVSDLTTCVPGYIIGRQMSARDALGPLRLFGLWDAVESDALLKFVERGHALLDSLLEDDLGAHENGSQPPPAMEVTRVQEKDLPRRVRLHFANFLKDHEPSEQAASRLNTEAVDEVDVEIAISMEPDYAAQLAEITLYEAYVSRNGYRFSLDNNWLRLEPTDCIEVIVDGERTERVRIVSVDYSIGGILKVEAVRDDDGTYVSTAVARPGSPSGGAPGGPGSALVCDTGMVILDIPCATPGTDAGYWIALYGVCESWACAEVYRSSDGGVTYGRVARTDLETTVGEIDSITGPDTGGADTSGYDGGSSITVTLFEGELESITDAQINAGQNMAAIGQDGRWVIIQFKTVVLDTTNQYTLTDLIWGLNDTQHLLGTTGAGDTFVLLSDSGLLRIPESPDAIGVTKQFKAVTCGQSIDDADVVNFTTWGLCYQRPCTSVVLSCSLTEPPASPTDGDAYLLPNDTSLSGVWAAHGGEIAQWSNETDSWVYCTPVPGTVIHCDDEDVDVIPPGGGDPPLPAPWPSAGATYLTEQDESATLPGSLRLVEGDQIAFETDTSGNTLTVHNTAPTIAEGDNITFDYDTSTNVITIHGEAGALQFKDEGSNLGTSGTADTVDFVGAGVTATRVGDVVTVTVAGTGSQAGLQFKDEGSNLGTAGTVDTVDFVGAGVTATRVSNAVTVTIPSGQAALQFKDEGSNLGSSGAETSVDFVGAGVTATESGGAVTVTIPGTGEGSWKEPVRVASVGSNVTISSALENGDTLDGVTLATGDRVLLKDQNTASQNGIYVVVASGTAARATDADTGVELVGATFIVTEGTVNSDRLFVCSTNAPITVGSTSIAFVQIGGGVSSGSAGVFYFDINAADFNINNSNGGTTFQDVVSVSGIPTGRYTLEGWLHTNNNATPGLKRQIHFTGTATQISYMTQTTGAATGTGFENDFDQPGTQTVTGLHYTNLHGAFNVTVSGTLSLQWAQSTASATNITVKAGTWMRLMKMA